MKEAVRLSASELSEAIEYGADQLGRPSYLLEKDLWVVWALQTLFCSQLAGFLTFKGGTSLSKGYGIIRRFSEDIDVTYDIRELLSDRMSNGDPIPPNRSQAGKWRSEIDRRLPSLLTEEVIPIIEQASSDCKSVREIKQDKSDVLIEYEPTVGGAPMSVLELSSNSGHGR